MHSFLMFKTLFTSPKLTSNRNLEAHSIIMDTSKKREKEPPADTLNIPLSYIITLMLHRLSCKVLALYKAFRSKLILFVCKMFLYYL